MSKTHIDVGPISGFENLNEAQHALFCDWKIKVAQAFALCGFTPFHPRPVEKLSSLLTQPGADVQKQIFALAKPDEPEAKAFGLPFDRTIPLAIFVATQGTMMTLPFKRQDISFSFRGERPQAGRFRGFIQADVDIVDTQLDWCADAQCIQALLTALNAIGLTNLKLCFNHIAIAQALLQSAVHPEALFASQVFEIFRILDKLASQPTAAKELHTITSPASASKILEAFSFQGTLELFFEKARLSHWLSVDQLASLEPVFDELRYTQQSLAPFKIEMEFRPGLVRGLQYYTGIVFETFLSSTDYPGSIASGGRYQSLVDDFAKKPLGISGTGGSIGLTRLFDVLNQRGLLSLGKKTHTQVLFGCRSPELLPQAMLIAQNIRNNLVLSIELLSGPHRKIKHILEIAHKKQIKTCILMMDTSTWVVKNLQSGTQTEVQSLEELTQACKKDLLTI